MEQIAVSFTDSGVPKTGLTPTVNIIGLDGTSYVQNGVCKEIGNGWYVYNFARYNPTKIYLYQFDGGSSLSNDYDRYKFGGNELDAYSNKYSWGRTAAPYFTSINGRFDGVDKAIKDAVDSRKEYSDKDIKKRLTEIKNEIKGKAGLDVFNKLDAISSTLGEVKQSVVDTSSANEGISSKNFSSVNDKLDLMAGYVVGIRKDLNSQLSSLDEDIANKINEGNNSLNEAMSSKVTIDQLLQQIERLENRLNDVVDAVVSKRLPRELTDKFDVNVSRKPSMNEADMAAALGIDLGLDQGINEGLDEGIDMGIGQVREQGTQAPVDMQGIAEPVMPTTI